MQKHRSAPGQFIKLQPQNTDFLDISDPKAVLETAFRNFSCLTVGDVFTFSYNDTTFEIAVLEVKPVGDKQAISVQETDLEVDFAPPVGYEEEIAKKKAAAAASGTSTPRSVSSLMASKGGHIQAEGSMAQSINYSAIAPNATTAADGKALASSNFFGSGNRLVAKKGKAGAAASLSSTPGTSTPTTSSPLASVSKTSRHRNGPQPLRLPPSKLFFGYEIKPLKSKAESSEQDTKVHFKGEGQTLRKNKDQK